MITEKSCGAVVFTRADGPFRFVIIQSKAGIYGFPKGHMEGNETESETALREVLEETGLRVRLLDDFRCEDSHPFECNGEVRMKHIVYFLAEYSDQIPVAQETEVSGIYLMDYESAMAAFQYDSSKRILAQANEFLVSAPFW